MKRLFYSMVVVLFISCEKNKIKEYKTWKVEYQIHCTQDAFINGRWADEFGISKVIFPLGGDVYDLDNSWPPAPWSHSITISADPSLNHTRHIFLYLYHGFGPNDVLNPPTYTLRILVDDKVAEEKSSLLSDHWSIEYELK